MADATTYPWSDCAAYALGQHNPLITLHPSYLAQGLDPPRANLLIATSSRPARIPQRIIMIPAGSPRGP